MAADVNDELPTFDPETDDTMGQTIPITEQRLFDLVRYARGYLLDEQLISMGEWTWLTMGATPDVPGAGSPSRNRLEEYDEIRAELDRARKELHEARDRVRQFMADINR